MKGILSFLVGVYVGTVISQRYKVPRAPSPGEAWREFKSRRREEHECGEERSRRHRRWNSELPPELKEALEKIKDFERRHRKPMESQQTPPGNYKPSEGVRREEFSQARNDEWSE
ncbi:hypothetical protein PoB_001251800 [Plakobranchus ocellatus]|uniref:Uncharacterized protein n=1 Tax=Plakobranchus ocellatus TaxID=259542 RepID=A0AAV3YTY4_9GAST|nr:hypothetical protein PoB_001251800 [Plakobranchus ocellatus]